MSIADSEKVMASPVVEGVDKQGPASKIVDVETGVTMVVNASGNVDVLERQYGTISVCAMALAIDNAWIALGGSVVVSIYNGGAPGVLYEMLTACFWYGFIAASLAEYASPLGLQRMASSIPSSGGVYHYAFAIATPRFRRAAGYYAGLLSYGGWIMNSCAIAQIPSNVIIQIWSFHHPDYVSQAWHTYVVYLMITWSSCFLCIFGNRLLPALQNLGLFLVLGGLLITICVLAAMPKVHATSAFVWKNFVNATGYQSNGVAFLTGVLNGAFVIGTPDSITHMAEELPFPRTQLPIGIAAQIILGTISAFAFCVALMYGISDLDSILSSVANFPLGIVYNQATNGSVSATTGLLCIVLLAILDSYLFHFHSYAYIETLAEIQCGRSWWALARDGATPFSRIFSRANSKLSCPVESTLLCGFLVTALGAIQLGSKTAFTDLVGAFILLTTISYAIPTTAHLVTGRQRAPKGPFWMGRFGFAVNLISVLLTAFFVVMFCFPFSMPVDVTLMNYSSVILVGYIVLVSFWWFWVRRTYVGPKIPHLESEGHVQEELDGDAL
ncbi:choline transport protein [Meredithblackwellia eburnea MCA 4105]